MNKKLLKVLGVLLAFGSCFLLHDLYDKFPSIVTSVFAPVNESIWEHMKILFGSILFAGVVQKIITIMRKEKINNICFSNFIGAICSIPIFLIIFLPVYQIIGENLYVTILIMFITIIIAEIISYIIMNKRNYYMENVTVFFVIVVYIVFTLLSYYPLHSELFKDPKTETYGITK